MAPIQICKYTIIIMQWPEFGLKLKKKNVKVIYNNCYTVLKSTLNITITHISQPVFRATHYQFCK